MKLSTDGLALIAEFEGFVGHGYNDAAGHCTIGYGHLLHTGGCSRSELARTMTRQQALELLDRDVDRFERAVSRLVTRSITQGQFDALVSFAFNVGEGALAGSTLLRKLNAGDLDGAAAEFGKWTRAGGVVLAGLARRRAAERALFVKPAGVPANRWDGYTANERKWITEYDRLLKAGKNIARRRVLRSLMAAQRKRIYRVAQPRAKGGDGRGWDYGNRERRYASLLARSR